MDIRILISLLKKNLIWFIFLPALVCGTIYYLTRNEPKIYRSSATLFTGFASGYTVLTDVNRGYVDHTAVNNNFDNLYSTIRSKETLSMVAIKLLTTHLYLKKPDPQKLDVAGFNQLNSLIKPELRQWLVAPNNELVTERRLDSLAHTSDTNPVKTLLFRSGSYYSVSRINAELKVTRKNTSDMLEMEYTSNEAAVAQHTLNYVIEVFRQRYISLKSSETKTVIGYFETQANQSKQKLESAESRIRSFGTSNNIVDLAEQGKNLSGMRETVYDQYQKELMNSKASKAALAVLEKRVSERAQVLNTNSELADKRAQLTEVNSKLANARAYNQPKSQIEQLEQRAEKIAEELRVAARNYYNIGSSTESLPQATIVDQWLARTLEFEESTARLKVYEKQLKDYDTELAKFTPLGSDLSKLKREKDLAEQEYTATLQELNQSRLKEKDVEMRGALALIDAPDFPLQPLASKRRMLLAAGLGAGLILAFILLLARHLMDNRISSPQQAEALIGLPVVAAFPQVRGSSPKSKAFIMGESMTDWLRTAIDIEINSAYNKNPYSVIIVFSTRTQEEKSLIARKIADHYSRGGNKVAYLFPNSVKAPPTSNILHQIPYAVSPHFADFSHVEELIEDMDVFQNTPPTVVIMELPNLADCAIPTRLVEQSTLSVLVMDAQSKWTQIDQRLYLLYKKVVQHPILCVLSRVDLNFIDLPQTQQASNFDKEAELNYPRSNGKTPFRLTPKTTATN